VLKQPSRKKKLPARTVEARTRLSSYPHSSLETPLSLTSPALPNLSLALPLQPRRRPGHPCLPEGRRISRLISSRGTSCCLLSLKARHRETLGCRRPAASRMTRARPRAKPPGLPFPRPGLVDESSCAPAAEDPSCGLAHSRGRSWPSQVTSGLQGGQPRHGDLLPEDQRR
jgi:hypothetical protein